MTTVSCRQCRAVGEFDDPEIAVGAHGDDVAAVDHLGPEQDRLVEGAGRELGAADAAREPEVVADHRARAGLAAHRRPFDERDAQSLGTGVHRRREAGGAATDHDDVVDAFAGPCPRAERFGDVDGSWDR